MRVFSLLCGSLLAGFVLFASAPAVAAAAAAPSTATADLLHALTLLKQQDMEFGELMVSGAGTAVLDPVSNTLSTTGGVAPVGSTVPHAALFTGAASGGAVVNIKAPTKAVTLTRVGGTETMTLSNFTLDGPSKRVMGASPSFQFRVGGTLTVAAGQVEGTYVGTFNVTAQYP